ncbi:MAG: hypothetical protein E7167_00655 [Firmicutes bacterium]|nr:hypothetical protein [Bacillota bacterium]
MAITSTSQILSTSKVATATSFIDDAIGYLNAAKENLKTAGGYASYDNFHTDQGSVFPDNTQALIEAIETIVGSLTELKTNVTNKAASINRSEWREYNEYVESQNNNNDPYTGGPVRV